MYTTAQTLTCRSISSDVSDFLLFAVTVEGGSLGLMLLLMLLSLEERERLFKVDGKHNHPRQCLADSLCVHEVGRLGQIRSV